MYLMGRENEGRQRYYDESGPEIQSPKNQTRDVDTLFSYLVSDQIDIQVSSPDLLSAHVAVRLHRRAHSQKTTNFMVFVEWVSRLEDRAPGHLGIFIYWIHRTCQTIHYSNYFQQRLPL